MSTKKTWLRAKIFCSQNSFTALHMFTNAGAGRVYIKIEGNV